jgi:uncharacterized OB-fold protein
MTVTVPTIRRTTDSADFFDAARRGSLLLRKCSGCGRIRGPQQPACGSCFSMEHSRIDSVGGAHLVSWSVVHRPPHPALTAPYLAGLVELDEGPWVLSRILIAEEEVPYVGMGLTVFIAPGQEDAEPAVMFSTAGYVGVLSTICKTETA